MTCLLDGTPDDLRDVDDDGAGCRDGSIIHKTDLEFINLLVTFHNLHGKGREEGIKMCIELTSTGSYMIGF